MSSTPIKHYSPLGISKLAMSATYCNRVVDTVNTVLTNLTEQSK